MASIASNLFYFLLRLINKKKFLQLQFAFGKFDFNNSQQPPRETRAKCDVTVERVDGRNVFTLTSRERPSGGYILYLHGGAYVQGFVRQHWTFLSRLVKETGSTVVAPDYPLAPLSTFVDAYRMVESVYKGLLSKAGAANTTLMGDSAGGGFALGLAQKMRYEGLPQPRQIILLSPWLDITLSNPDIAQIDPQDPFLGIAGLKKAGKAYAGAADPNMYCLSPVNGPVDGLARISLFIGARDIFVADARRLKSLAEAQGVAINYREYKDMVHVWMLLNFHESKLATREIIDLIKDWEPIATDHELPGS